MSNTSLTSKVQQSRGWTLALGIGAAALAAILLIAYLVQYRSSVNDSTAPSPVLVAKNLIPKGTSGTVIAEKQLFQAATLSKDDLKVGAISDPAYLNGRVAVADIFPGQQITTADLSVGLTDAIPTQLTGIQRAVAIPVDGARGMVGYVASGDRVDIYYETGSTGGTVLGLLAPNVLVMRAAASGAPAILRAEAPLAQKLALASDSGTLWFLLRPAGDAKNPPKKSITSTELLAQINGQTVGADDGPFDPRIGRSRRPRCLRRPAGAAGRPELHARRDDGGRGRDRPGAGEGLARSSCRRLSGARGRPVAPDHQRRAPLRPRRADHRARLDVAERVPPAGVRGRGRRHGDLPADEGAAALRDEHRDRTPSGPAGAAVGAQGQPADLRARPEGRDGQDPHVDATSRRRSPSRARRCSSSTSTSSSGTSRSASGSRPRRRCTTSRSRPAASTRTS